MATQKIYAGSALRETRSRTGLTQRRFAEALGVSLPYLSQMENNHRPISAGALLRLAQEFGVDLTTLAAGDAGRMVVDMREALADPLFDSMPPLADLRLAATNAPVLARFDATARYGSCAGPLAARAPDDSLDMGTAFDCFSPRSFTRDQAIAPEQRARRQILLDAMQRRGFVNYKREWWHFSYPAADTRTAYDFPVEAR